MSEAGREVRCMLIPLHRDRLLLPNATVAEIIGYRDPDRIDGAPDWISGQVNWHQRQVPVVDFERLLGRGNLPPGIRQRIAICYAPEPEQSCPLFGIIAQGIPRLLRVDRSSIDSAEHLQRHVPSVQMRVIIDGEPLLVPELSYLQQQVAAAA